MILSESYKKRLQELASIEESKENLKGGLADNKTISDIAKHHNVSVESIEKQFKLGLKVEREHSFEFKIQKEIVKDHLMENPEYYTILEKAGL